MGAEEFAMTGPETQNTECSSQANSDAATRERRAFVDPFPADPRATTVRTSATSHSPAAAETTVTFICSTAQDFWAALRRP